MSLLVWLISRELFPTTQILREINFCKPRVSTSAILTVLAPLKFGFSECMHFVRAEIYLLKIKIQSF